VAKPVKIVWFRHPDEHRNDLLRFGLMRLARARDIDYLELTLGECVDYGFPATLTQGNPHHASVVAVEDGPRRVRCIIDSEDSFYWMSKHIADCDLFFCAGYNADFFQRRIFAGKYAWQRDDEVSFYRARTAELVAMYGHHFDKARPFVPIGPSLAFASSRSFIQQKAANLHHRVASRLSRGRYWKPELDAYEQRYAQLLALRQAPLRHDVTLLDTLWGWPRHRVALHRTLADLGKHGADVHARLSWADPVPFDASETAPEDRASFPMKTGVVTQYEVMLAGSRLGVFATGFHWGWRSIMSLAMMVGIPVLIDRPLLQPWFDLSRLDVQFNDDGNWDLVHPMLASISDRAWLDRKIQNAVAYDEVMSPEAVAWYFANAALT
jgi:hypothetical protein